MKLYTPAQARKLAERMWRDWAYLRCEPSIDTMRVLRDCARQSPTRSGRCYAAILHSLR